MRNVNVNLQQNSQLRETAVIGWFFWVIFSHNFFTVSFRILFCFLFFIQTISASFGSLLIANLCHYNFTTSEKIKYIPKRNNPNKLPIIWILDMSIGFLSFVISLTKSQKDIMDNKRPNDKLYMSIFEFFVFIVWSLINAGWKLAYNVPPLLVSCELRNELFSVKDKNSCETQTWTYHKIRNCEKRLLWLVLFSIFEF